MHLCAICGKKPFHGSAITYRGMLKKDGGVGRKIVRVNPRRFMPNLQRTTVLMNGTIKRIKVCTTCLRAGRVLKAPPKPSRPAGSAAAPASS